MNNVNQSLSQALRLCRDAGVVFDEGLVIEQLEAHLSLIQEWNQYASLVSIGDAESGLLAHCLDSLSIAPSIFDFVEKVGGSYVDIGTGGGFPAIPLSILFPDLEVTLVDRNTKKTVFLKKVVGRLGLENVSVETESFEGEIPVDGCRVITARAIEKPTIVIPEIVRSMRIGDRFLCQSESIHELASGELSGCLVREIEDEFSAAGMRRNRLYQIELLE